MDGTLSEIRMWGANFAPSAWAYCDGQILAISSNAALFSLLGTTFGGDGVTTFGLPDFRGRFPIGEGTGPGLSNRNLGSKGGLQSVTLSTTNLPSHTHTAAGTVSPQVSSDVGDEKSAVSTYPAEHENEEYGTTHSDVGGASPVTVTVDPVGSGVAHDNMPPFTTVHFIICIAGIYPSA